MLFDKNNRKVNDRVIYTSKPNILFGCKKVIFAIIFLIILLTLYSMAIRFVGNMQVYMISRINFALAQYMTIAFFVIVLITVIYIIFQVVGWYSTEYVLTDTKIIVKFGVLNSKKNYMPYTTIQDLNTSQSIIARLFNVGSVSVFSAYDNNQMELKHIHNPSEVEDLIFSKIGGYRNFQAPPQPTPHYHREYANDETFFHGDYVKKHNYDDDFVEKHNYDDDFVEKHNYDDDYEENEQVSSINHEKNIHHQKEFDIPSVNFKKTTNKARHTYEYEPYNSRFNRGSDDNQNDTQYNRVSDDDYHQDGSSRNKHNRVSDDDYRQDGSSRNKHNRVSDDDYRQDGSSPNENSESVDEKSHDDKEYVVDLSKKAIERHFNKFKK